MHPATPVLRGWKFVVGVLAVVAVNVRDDPREVADLVADERGIVGGAVAALAAAGFVVALLAWRATRFAVTDDAVSLHWGVLFRQQRRARLDHLQAVDVVQPFLARLVGLAELRLEVAGGAGSAVVLSYLREADAVALRRELLARAAGARARVTGSAPGPGAAGPGDPGDGGLASSAEPDERVLVEVPPGRVVAGTLRSGSAAGLVLVTVGIVVLAVATDQPGVVAGAMLPVLLGLGGFLWSRVNHGVNFAVSISDQGIRLRHGLMDTRTQSLPPRRVQALRLTQGPCWRRPDWWRVEMNVAGYGMSGEQVEETVLLPVASREEAVLAVWLVLPDLGTSDPRGLLERALSGVRTADGAWSGEGPDVLRTSPPGARWVDPWGWRRRAVAVTDRALLVRSGRLVRRLVIVPHERMQSVALRRGPLQRRLGLASVQVHSTPGPVIPVASHLAAAQALRLVMEEAERAGTARAGDEHAGPGPAVRSDPRGPTGTVTGVEPRATVPADLREVP